MASEQRFGQFAEEFLDQTGDVVHVRRRVDRQRSTRIDLIFQLQGDDNQLSPSSPSANEPLSNASSTRQHETIPPCADLQETKTIDDQREGREERRGETVLFQKVATGSNEFGHLGGITSQGVRSAHSRGELLQTQRFQRHGTIFLLLVVDVGDLQRRERIDSDRGKKRRTWRVVGEREDPLSLTDDELADGVRCFSFSSFFFVVGLTGGGRGSVRLSSSSCTHSAKAMPKTFPLGLVSLSLDLSVDLLLNMK